MDRDEEIVIKWRCQKLPCQFHHSVDHKEYEKALPLLTPDVDWWSKGIMLMSCDEILGGLHGALGDGTIRHVFTDIPQMTSKFAGVVLPIHRHGNSVPFVALRCGDFGGLIKFGTPFGKVFHHLDAPLPSFSALR